MSVQCTFWGRCKLDNTTYSVNVMLELELVTCYRIHTKRCWVMKRHMLHPPQANEPLNRVPYLVRLRSKWLQVNLSRKFGALQSCFFYKKDVNLGSASNIPQCLFKMFLRPPHWLYTFVGNKLFPTLIMDLLMWSLTCWEVSPTYKRPQEHFIK